MILPGAVAAVDEVVTRDLPLVWPAWLMDGEVPVAGELIGGRWPAAFAKAAKRPSGFVPYCTGWNNLIREKQMHRI